MSIASCFTCVVPALAHSSPKNTGPTRVEGNFPGPITSTVHDALLALGRAAASVAHEHTVVKDEPYILTCTEAATYMLLGCEFNFATLACAMYYRRHSNLRRARKLIHSLPKSSPTAFQRAAAVYKKAVASDRLYVDRALGKGMGGMSEAAKARLALNAQDLNWCNDVWLKLFLSGATKIDAAELFVSMIMASMLVNPPAPEFPSLRNSLGTIRTFDELNIIKLSAKIRRKPDWRLNIQKNDVISQWQEEARAYGFTRSMVEFLLAEIKWFAGQYEPETGIEPAGISGVFLSDSLIPGDVHRSLRIGTNALAAILENQKDWNPNTYEQVLALVHPSVYPFVRYRTRRYPHKHEELSSKTLIDMPTERIHMDAVATSVLNVFHNPPPPNRFPTPAAALDAAGDGVISSIYTFNFADRIWKGHSDYQWLPVDVEISSSIPHTARFLSYVNNLHPSPETAGGALYPVLEGLFARFIPLFERMLTDARLRGVHNTGVRSEFLSDSTDGYWDPHPPDPRVDPNSFEERHAEWKVKRKFVRPVVKPFVPPPSPGSAQIVLGGRVLQVIVKILSVVLMPERPGYMGGGWVTDGSDNECIVGTGVYYFDSENIGESSLGFSQNVLAPQDQDDVGHLEHLYGIHEADMEARRSQYLGSMITPEGRCVCYPNGMPHRASSFKLVDPTKPGHQKMVVFHLVDPNQRILSTLDVPPQQLEWFLREIRLQTGTRLHHLPAELFNLICEYVRELAEGDVDFGRESLTWLMTLAEAREHRLRLAAEGMRE